MSRYTYDKTSKELDMIAGVPAMDGTPVEDSVKPITSGGVYDVVDEFTQINNEFGVKNLCPNDLSSIVTHGITCIVNRRDGSITINGTAEITLSFQLNTTKNLGLVAGEEYILTGCPKNGSTDTFFLDYAYKTDASASRYSHFYDIGDGVTFIEPDIVIDLIQIMVMEGSTIDNLTFYPMIRPAYITDDTYEPYARSNQELTGEVEPMLNVLGAKNLLPNTATTQTMNGVTFTVREDGSVLVNGTATNDTWFCLDGDSNAKYSKQNFGNCYLSSGINLNSEMKLQVYWSDDGTTFGGSVTSRGNDSLIPSHAYYSQGIIAIPNGKTINNEIVYPMIRPASVADDTYVPYAMTNRELTNMNNYSIKEIVYNGSFPTRQTTYNLTKDISEYDYALIRTDHTSSYVNLKVLRKDGAAAFSATTFLNTSYYEAIFGSLQANNIYIAEASAGGWTPSYLTVYVYK